MTMIRHTDDWGRTIFRSDAAFELLYAGTNLEDILIENDEKLEVRNSWFEHYDQEKRKTKPIEQPDITAKNYHLARQNDWNLPSWILEVDIRSLLHELCSRDDEHARVDEEMDLFESRQMIKPLQMLMYLVIYWRENNILWGVGRGSSVASYCLYLLGVHRIDSIKYGLDIHEFLR